MTARTGNRPDGLKSTRPGALALAYLMQEALMLRSDEAPKAMRDVEALLARCEAAEADAERLERINAMLAKALDAIVASLSQPVQGTTSEANAILRGDAAFARNTASGAISAYRAGGGK